MLCVSAERDEVSKGGHLSLSTQDPEYTKVSLPPGPGS